MHECAAKRCVVSSEDRSRVWVRSMTDEIQDPNGIAFVSVPKMEAEISYSA